MFVNSSIAKKSLGLSMIDISSHIEYKILKKRLHERAIQFEETRNQDLPIYAMMHNHSAPIPYIVITPQSEWGLSETLRLIWDNNLYEKVPVSVRSSGHGYFNGASCEGIMINLSDLTRARLIDNVLIMEPGRILGQTVHFLWKAKKALPQGDCFEVAAGGHFTTAGWDVILSRKYGLGCQSLLGGRIVLWNGTVLDVNEHSHPDLLWSMRGGGAAGVGIVSDLRLQLIDEPENTTWRLNNISKEHLKVCVANRTMTKGLDLPREISMIFRLSYVPDREEPLCQLMLFSLLEPGNTLESLSHHLGDEVVSIMSDIKGWSKGRLMDIRMLPASDFLRENPEMLSELRATNLKEDPFRFWEESTTRREMGGSYLNTVSGWTKAGQDSMLLELYEAFESVRNQDFRFRMYAIVVVGGGRMTELQDRCAMPLGEILTRFEIHWGNKDEDKSDYNKITEKVHSIMQRNRDPIPNRPYRGDIWLKEQACDPRLDAIRRKYDTREKKDAGGVYRAS